MAQLFVCHQRWSYGEIVCIQQTCGFWISDFGSLCMEIHEIESEETSQHSSSFSPYVESGLMSQRW